MCSEHSRSIIVSSIAYCKVFPVNILIHEHPLMLEVIYVRPFNRLMLVEGGFSLFLIIVGYAFVFLFCCMGD